MKNDDPVCPVIESVRDAIALGAAMAKVLHYDRGWAERVYNGDPTFRYNTGPRVLNDELRSLWFDGYTTIEERRAIITEMVAARLA